MLLLPQLLYLFWILPIPVPNLFWRRCGREGTLIHILWRCPSLSSFWSGISAIILQVLKTNISLSPGLALFSLEIELIPHHLSNMLIHILLAAQMTLVWHWKDHKPPTVGKVIQITQTRATYEIMFAPANGNYQKANKIWELWDHWYNRSKPTYTLIHILFHLDMWYTRYTRYHFLLYN